MSVIFEYDFGTELYMKLGKHKVFEKVDGWVVKVEINDHLLKLLKQNHDDLLITQLVSDKGRKLCKETEAKLETHILTYVKSKKSADAKAVRTECYKLIDDELKAVKAKVKDLPRVQWNKLLLKVDEKTKEYKKYKSGAIIDVVMSSGGLLIAAGAVASAGASFGATSIPALIASVRAIAKFAQSVKTIAEEAETVKKRAQANIGKFLETYAKKRKGVQPGDVAKAVLNGVLGFDVANTVGTLIKDVDLWSAKSGGIYIAGVKFARLATEINNAIEKSRAELKAKNVDPGVKAKMEKALEKLEKTFTTNFQKASISMARAKDAMKGLKETKANLALIQGNTPGYLQKMDKIVGLITGFTLAAAGATTGFIEAGTEAAKLVVEAIKSVDELANLIKEVAS